MTSSASFTQAEATEGRYDRGMDAKNNLFAFGAAALLPAVVTNAVCVELNAEIRKDEWQRSAPAQHHTADQDPSAPPAPANDSAATVGGIPPIRIDIPSAPFALEDDSGYLLLEDGSGYIATEPRHLIAMVG
jgi:hypothetical protein